MGTASRCDAAPGSPPNGQRSVASRSPAVAGRRLPGSPSHPHSHILAPTGMRELALECGYSASSIRERIYASAPDNGGMAGVLLYTAAPDSEGTLGGLVRLGEPRRSVGSSDRRSSTLRSVRQTRCVRNTILCLIAHFTPLPAMRARSLQRLDVNTGTAFSIAQQQSPHSPRPASPSSRDTDAHAARPAATSGGRCRV